ncbi:MAG: hypothetical protein WAK55_22030 [Xanthobacteraceae bacterium]
MSDITTAISLAQEKNEQSLAQHVSAPPTELDTEALLLLRRWAEFCRSRGIRACPARPASVAMYIRLEHSSGVPVEKTLASLAAITAMHNQASEANPVACAMPQAELSKILTVKAPRSWRKDEALLWGLLPPDVQSVIKRHIELDSLALRRLQNRVADFSKKEIANDEQKTDH